CMSVLISAGALAKDPGVSDHNARVHLNRNGDSLLEAEKTAINVTGRVIDEDGMALPGVNVVIKGTTSGTTTDGDGRYSIEVPDANSVLVFSFVGFSNQEVTVGNRTVIDITMVLDVKSLQEVVVTALGIEKSTKSLGYATTKVDASELSVNR